MCECGSKRALELGAIVFGCWGKKVGGTFSMRGPHVFVWVLNGFDAMGSKESEAVAEVEGVGVGERSNSLMSSGVGSESVGVWRECGSGGKSLECDGDGIALHG